MAYKPGENDTKDQTRAKPIRDALNALITRPTDDLLNDKPQTIAQRIEFDLVKDATNEIDPKIRMPLTSTDSPNRVDALVWACTELLIDGPGTATVSSLSL